MPRRPGGVLLPTFAELDEAGGDPLHVRVYRRLRGAVLGGALAPGDRLPSTRTLARDLGVSRNTVEAAFSQLDAEGYLERRVGAGSYVARVLPLRPEPRRGAEPAAPPASPPLSARGRAMAEAGDRSDPASGRAFAPCVPGLDAFPVRTWQALLSRRARALDRELLTHGDTGGYRPLREAVAAHLAAARGVRCGWRQVLVVGSTQQALDLAARLLLDPGDAVWMEDPGYLGARAAFAGAGARLVPVPIDADGMDVDAGLRRAPDARLAYVTPSHQYPMGTTLSLARRLALIDWATEAGAWIVEDDYDSEFRYVGRPLAAAQGLDAAGCVLYAGTFNKSVFPGLRLAYLVVPEHAADAFEAAWATVDGPPPTLTQAVMADFIRDGHFAAHVRAMRTVYQERRVALLDAVETHLAGRVAVGSASTGMHVALRLPPGTDDRAVSAAAARRGMDVPPLSRYHLADPAPGLILHYASVPAPDVRRGVALLREVLDETGTGRFPASPPHAVAGAA